MFGFLPQNLYTNHVGQNTTGLSPRLWSKLYGTSMQPDGDKRLILAGDDFTVFDGLVAANVGRYSGNGGGYRSYEDTGGSIAQLATQKGGVITIATDNTDNDECWLQSGGASGVLGAISDTAGADHLTVFEARFKVNKIANTYNMFIGLAEEGLAAADTVTDAGAMASKDFLGFRVLEADGDELDWQYRLAGQADTEAKDGVAVLVADTWVKAGFIYDPTAPTSKRIKCFIDNVEQATYITGTQIAAATFPDGEELAFLAGVKNGDGSISSLSIDWWAFGQLI